ncbi:MAG: hypothetical protein HRT35_20575 [Algicola sp.]|nr:hypothetical protein [Algicola sp.]
MLGHGAYNFADDTIRYIENTAKVDAVDTYAQGSAHGLIDDMDNALNRLNTSVVEQENEIRDQAKKALIKLDKWHNNRQSSHYPPWHYF